MERRGADGQDPAVRHPRCHAASAGPHPLRGVSAGLGQLGYTEGQQVAFLDQNTGGAPSRLQALAAELVRTKPDVIFARGPAPVSAAAAATKTIPIVAVDLESDPRLSPCAHRGPCA